MAKSPAERKRDQRARDKLSAQEKEALLLSRKIVTALYHNDDAALNEPWPGPGSMKSKTFCLASFAALIA